MLTMTDALKAVNPVLGELYRVAQGSAPELDLLPTKTISGLQYRRPKLSTGDSVSGTRTDNAGVVAATAAIGFDSFDLATYTKYLTLDSRVASGFGDQLATMQAEQAAFKTIEQRAEIGSAFYTALLAAAVANTSGLKKAGAGTTAANTSAYLVYLGPQGAEAILSKDSLIGDWEQDDITYWDATAEKMKSYPGWKSFIQTHAAFSLGDAQGVARVANCDASAPLTDSLLSDALALLPTVYTADKNNLVILVSRRGRSMIQHSRTTAVNVNVPTPTDFDGYRIMATDSIPNTEAVVA